MKTLITIFTMSLLSTVAAASERICVDTIHGNLCAKKESFQDSSMKHFAYGINEFTLNDRKIVLSKDFSAKFICRAFDPNGINPRPQLPFGLAKMTEKVVIGHTIFSNGDCRPIYGDNLVEVDCYSDQ